MDDEKFYDQVVQELRTDGPREGLWLKAVTEANGDEKRAKIQYVKWRVAELAQQHKDNVEHGKAEQERRRLDEIHRRANSPEAVEERRRDSVQGAQIATGVAVVLLLIGVIVIMNGDTTPATLFLVLGVIIGTVTVVELVRNRRK